MAAPKTRRPLMNLAQEAVQLLREIHEDLRPKDVCSGDGRREFEELLKKEIEEEMAKRTGISEPALGVPDPDPDLIPRYRAAIKATRVAREQEQELEKELQRLYTDLFTLRNHGYVLRPCSNHKEQHRRRVWFPSHHVTRLCAAINRTTEALTQAARVRKAAGHYHNKLEAELPEAERRGLAIEQRYM